MAEYIERESVKQEIIEAVDNGMATTSDDLAEIIDDLPCVDVVPAEELAEREREIERLQAEVERLHRENFWLTGHKEGEQDETA